MGHPGRKPESTRRDVFVHEYLKDLHGTNAAIRAGYSTKTAAQAAARLLARDDVKKAVAEATGQVMERADVESERVIREVSAIAMKPFASDDIRMVDKMRALELLMRYLGLLVERREVTINPASLTNDQAQALELLKRTGVL